MYSGVMVEAAIERFSSSHLSFSLLEEVTKKEQEIILYSIYHFHSVPYCANSIPTPKGSAEELKCTLDNMKINLIKIINSIEFVCETSDLNSFFHVREMNYALCKSSIIQSFSNVSNYQVFSKYLVLIRFGRN